jgi:RNA polymerase sigma-70 factor (ECF subfamily)
VAFDAVQDVFLTAHQILDGYLGKSKRKTWLFGIALNVARNYRRRHARSGEDDALIGDDEFLANASSASGDPWDAACRAESMRLLERVLSTLDEPDRQLFVLVTLHDMTVTETAKLLGLVESRARNRLLAIKTRLSAELNRLSAQDEWRLR